MSEYEGIRLYDRIMATGVEIPGVENQTALKREQAWLSEVLQHALVFNIQNVADYYHLEAGQKKDWRQTDFPNVAPPFQCYFMEFNTRRDWYIEDRPVHSAGILSFATDYEPKERGDSHPTARWIVENTMFTEDRKWEPKAWTKFYSFVQPNGEIAPMDPPSETGSDVRGQFLMSWLDRREPNEKELQIVALDAISGFYPTLLALSFLHCKNVTISTEEPPVRLNRTFQRRHDVPLTRFHTLNIEPMKTILKREGQVEKLGLKRALHIVRGHFADYRESGLFGMHKGMYWFDQHLRGSIEEGQVIKDYNLQLPEDGANPVSSK